MILVKTFFAANPLRNYSYLVAESETGEAWVIDPFAAGPVIDYIRKNGLVLKGILNTHQHWDHVHGNAPLRDAFGAPVHELKSSDAIRLSDDYTLEALATPGHTLDHQAFLWKERGMPRALFSGDTLFNAGVGNCRGGGDVDLLFATTERLRGLPPETVLYPGHDYRRRNLEFALSVEPENRQVARRLREIGDRSTEELAPATLGEELAVNPFLRLDLEELRQIVGTGEEPLSEPVRLRRELFKRLRQLRDQW